MENEIYLGRNVINKLSFTEKGTFKSMYAAQRYLSHNGFSYGSTSVQNPVAFMKGEYVLPQKWYNINDEGRKLVDGVMESNDFREGTVSLIFFEPLKIKSHE